MAEHCAQHRSGPARKRRGRRGPYPTGSWGRLVAQLSVETGIDQPTLYGQPSDDVLTLAEAVRDRNERDSWTNVHELLAQLIELLSIVRIEQLAAAGVKRWALPDMVRIPRPGDDKAQEAIVVTPSQFARMTVMG